MENTMPSTNGKNGGRDSRGRFAKGNGGGPGNPFARQVAKLRGALLKAVKPADLTEIIAGLVAAAKGGDVSAAKVLFDRTLGPPLAADILTRIEELEFRLRGQNDEH